MLCRLCLVESEEILEIYTEEGEIAEEDVLNVVAKHFQIDICYDDVVSNIICLTCLGYLDEFHKYWLSVDEKQKTLNSELDKVEIKRDLEDSKNVTATDKESDSKISNLYIELCARPERYDCVEGANDNCEVEFLASSFEQEEDASNLLHDSISITEYLIDEIDKTSVDAETEKDTTVSKQKREVVIETDVDKATRKRGRPKKNKNQEEKHTSKRPDFFKCSICNKLWVNRGSYIKHMKSQHPPGVNFPYKCRHCSKKFSKETILDSHIKTRHTSLYPTCKLCNKTVANTFILRQHVKSVHLNEFESVCDICGKLFKNPGSLQKHMDNIHNTKPRPEAQCTICKKWLKSKITLRNHMMKHRDEASGVVFKCPHCNAEKTTKRSIASHIRYHHTNRILPCTMCDKEFKTPLALKEHEATHTGEYLYSCPFCQESFRAHSNLHKHKLRAHSKEYVPKHSQPSEYTQSVLNRARNAMKS